MQAFSGEVEEGVNSERRHFKLNKFSWGTNPSNYSKLRKPCQECVFASSLSERQRQKKLQECLKILPGFSCRPLCVLNLEKMQLHINIQTSYKWYKHQLFCARVKEIFQSYGVAGFHPVRHPVKVTGLFNHHGGLLFILAAYLVCLQGHKTFHVLMKKHHLCADFFEMILSESLMLWCLLRNLRKLLDRVQTCGIILCNWMLLVTSRTFVLGVFSKLQSAFTSASRPLPNQDFWDSPQAQL